MAGLGIRRADRVLARRSESQLKDLGERVKAHAIEKKIKLAESGLLGKGRCRVRDEVENVSPKHGKTCLKLGLGPATHAEVNFLSIDNDKTLS